MHRTEAAESRLPRSYPVPMADNREPLTAEDLDAMTPNERAAAFEERIVRDVDELPPSFLNKVMATGRRIADQLRTAPTE
jgi:hypothetical protein